MDPKKEHFISGAALDERTEEEKKSAYPFREIVAAANPVVWKEKLPSEWRKFPIFNQNGSGSCVAQTEGKELGIMRWLKDKNYVHFSATDIYQQRANRPAAGMAAFDARGIVAKNGATLEVLTPSQGLSDEQMDSTVVEPYKRQVGQVFAVPNYLEFVNGDMESIASFIQTTGKGVMVWFYFTYEEWTDHPTILNPSLDIRGLSTIRHSVTAVDFALVNGKKCLIIEDSWGPQYGLSGQRVIDIDFFIARNYYAGYLMNFKFEQPSAPNKPKHTFNVDLVFETEGPEVIALQDCLKYEGLFPVNGQSTGYFGAITRKAVQDFQVKYGIASQESAGYGRVGPLTRAKLNTLFS